MKPRARIARFAIGLFTLAALVSSTPRAQVPAGRLLHADDEPQNWLMYSGNYSSRRHTTLKQIDASNIKELEVKWIWQARSLQSFEATPLVVDGVMYVTQPPNDVVALDARTGQTYWVYRYPLSATRLCCRGGVNRGLAIQDDMLFMAAADAQVVAIDAKSGKLLWKTKLAETPDGYGMTLAPLVVRDKVIVGVAGGEHGIRGFIDGYDTKTGRRAWRFYTVPGPGEPGHETWAGDSWKNGGASVWLTGSYDPELNLTYWGIGNPGPDFNSRQRLGDNLYSDSVVALDPDTGKLKWHFQFTPNDPYDYDSTQVPVLVDTTWNGQPRKLMYWANRNGFFYVLDRATGEFLLGKPFVPVNWASGLDAKGRPILTPQPPDKPTYPGVFGATNWYSPSYSPRTGLFYVSVWEGYASAFAQGEPVPFVAGQNFMGPLPPLPGAVPMPAPVPRGPINTWHGNNGHGLVVALDPKTGDRKWAFPMHDVNTSGILTTATDLLFVGGRETYFQVLDARTGALLRRFTVGGETAAGPMSYQVNGQQYVAVAAGNALLSFGLRDR